MAGPSTIQWVGTRAPLQRDFEVHLGPEGTTTRFRVTCPILDTLVALANYYTQFGAQVRFVGPDGGDDREIEVEIPGLTSTTFGVLSELFFDKWELISNEGSDSIFANPFLVGPNGVLNYNDKIVLSRLTLDGGTVAMAVTSCNADLAAGTLGPAPDDTDGGTADGQFQAPTAASSQQLAKMIQKGQTDYYTPQYVLRHTSYCSPGAIYNSSVSGQGLIYTTAQLLNEVELGWTYDLPPRLSSKIASIPIQVAPPDEAPYYQWGWLKKIGRETQMANFMIQVDIEYALALWSTLDYGLQ
jgi:hypothetical protein